MKNLNIATLSLGGVTISIESENRLFIELVRYEFKGFLTSNKKPTLKVRVIIDDTKETNTYTYGRPHHLNVVVEGKKLFSRGSTYSGVFDISTLTAEVRQALVIGPLYLFLRFVLSAYLPLVDGFFIHSTSIVKDNKCFLFSGKPQSGKSTVAKLSKEHQILSDDFSMVRKINGIFCGFGSPFWGHIEVKGENIKNDTGCIPIKGIYFLKQDDKVYVEKLDKREALLQLIKNIAIITKSKSINAKIIQLTEAFVNQIPAYYLYFRLDNSFWRCIENA